MYKMRKKMNKNIKKNMKKNMKKIKNKNNQYKHENNYIKIYFNNKKKNKSKKNVKNKMKKKSQILKIHNYQNEFYELIFVCHSTETVLKCIQKYPHSSILFVSQNDLNIDLKLYKNVIVARDLIDNIEHYPNLLSFTAWYAISKNKLFNDKDYLCILEYDVELDNELLKKIDISIKNSDPNCISFIRNLDGFKFEADIQLEIIDLFTNHKYPFKETWYPTTNHCLKRSLLDDFVKWYYPKCMNILLNRDLNQIPWYHERIFNVYLYFNISKRIYLEGLKHIQNNSHGSSLINITNRTVKCNHNAGFFSCSSLLLHHIIHSFNKYRHLPYIVDSSEQYSWYKPNDRINEDITQHYFKKNQMDIRYRKNINYDENDQYSIYKDLPMKDIYPFIQKYFTISDEVLQIKNDLEKKYKIEYENTCVLFYRGNDKITEVDLPLYTDYVKYAIKIRERNKNIRFFIQSDETEFLNEMSQRFENHFIMKDDIRHMSRCINTVDKITPQSNFEYSKKYLAITNIMSKCKYIIFGSGNCSIWIVFYRGHSNNIIQYCNHQWYSSLVD